MNIRTFIRLVVPRSGIAYTVEHIASHDKYRHIFCFWLGK